MVRVVAVPPAVLVGSACWTYVSSAVVEVWLHVPLVRVWLHAWSCFEAKPRLAAYPRPIEAPVATRITMATRREMIVRRDIGYCMTARA
jgi:hypothetical protein